MNYSEEDKRLAVPRQARSQQKVQALLESAQILFSAQGYDKVTAMDIAEHANVSIGTFYRYFPDKKQLLLLIWQNKMESYFSTEATLSGQYPYDTMEKLIRNHFTWLREFGMNDAMRAAAFREPDVKLLVQSTLEKIENRFAAKLEQLKLQEVTWPDLDTNTAAWAVISLIGESFNKKGLQTSEEGVNKLIKTIVRMLFQPQYHHKGAPPQTGEN